MMTPCRAAGGGEQRLRRCRRRSSTSAFVHAGWRNGSLSAFAHFALREPRSDRPALAVELRDISIGIDLDQRERVSANVDLDNRRSGLGHDDFFCGTQPRSTGAVSDAPRAIDDSSGFDHRKAASASSRANASRSSRTVAESTLESAESAATARFNQRASVCTDCQLQVLFNFCGISFGLASVPALAARPKSATSRGLLTRPLVALHRSAALRTRIPR